jgi:hypothetical protein
MNYQAAHIACLSLKPDIRMRHSPIPGITYNLGIEPPQLLGRLFKVSSRGGMRVHLKVLSCFYKKLRWINYSPSPLIFILSSLLRCDLQ